jgi:hypothetical protein
MSSLVFAAPALPLHSAGKYVAGAYIVFVALVLIYVAIMARRLSRTERELAQLRREAEAQADAVAHERERERERVAAGGLTRPPSGEPGWRVEA